MNGFKDRRATGLLLFQKGRGRWVLAVTAAMISLLVLLELSGSDTSDISLRDLASLQKVETAVSGVSKSLAVSQEAVPAILKDHIESLFKIIESNPPNRDSLLRELKRVLQQSFKGQEDCWSCVGTEYFDRYDALVGSAESRKPLGLKEWIALGDEAFQQQQLDDARASYSEALQIMDERVFEPDESVDTKALDRITERCKQLNCR